MIPLDGIGGRNTISRYEAGYIAGDEDKIAVTNSGIDSGTSRAVGAWLRLEGYMGRRAWIAVWEGCVVAECIHCCQRVCLCPIVSIGSVNREHTSWVSNLLGREARQ